MPRLKPAVFRCFNCGRGYTQAASIPLIIKFMFMAFWLILTQNIRWPSNTCRNCAENVYVVAICMFLAVLAIAALVFAMRA